MGETAETKAKIGMIKNALRAEGRYIDAANSGDRQNRIAADSGVKIPLIGKIPFGKWVASSTPIDESRVMMGEAIGRLHSGGAINDDERAQFEGMIPTASDDASTYERKLKNYSEMMRDKLSVFGYTPEELGIRLPDINIPGAHPETKGEKMAQQGGTTAAAVRGLLNTALFGHYPQVNAAVNTAGEALFPIKRISGETDGLLNNYRTERDIMADTLDAQQRQFPNATRAGEILGLLGLAKGGNAISGGKMSNMGTGLLNKVKNLKQMVR
jgi:hypothetical protein